MSKRWLIIISAFLIIVILAYALLLNPVFQEKLAWHAGQWVARIKTMLNPPEQVSFSSSEDGAASEDFSPTPQITTLTPDAQTQNIPPTTFETLPPAYSIAGGTYFSQHNRWNYCGPAGVAMLLSYWDWDGTHDDAARILRTHTRDKNVMPYELVDFIREEANLDALIRVGGDLDTLKRLIASGFPVLVEKGPHFRDIHNELTWMGHYQVLSGYHDVEGYFIAQDSYMEANYHQPYDDLIDEWRSFNYLYIVAFPTHLRNDVLNLLGPNADETANNRNALTKAQDEIFKLEGVQQFFAMFNYGTNLVALRDYIGAAAAYDQAFRMYDELPASRSVRPYRILWYQTGPFFAYYYSGRYHDVIEKATRNSIDMVRDDIPALEESWYWRGKARLAIGERNEGIKDLQTCLEYRNRFPPCIEALNDVGIYP